MAKLRLQIENEKGNLEIIMRNINYLIIDGIEFRKDDYVTGSRVTQEFYNFVKRNKHKITFISYRQHSIDDYVNKIHLKNGKLHCEFEQAYQRLFNGYMLNLNGYYYLEGKKFTHKEWLLKLRKIKLERLNS